VTSATGRRLRVVGEFLVAHSLGESLDLLRGVEDVVEVIEDLTQT